MCLAEVIDLMLEVVEVKLCVHDALQIAVWLPAIMNGQVGVMEDKPCEYFRSVALGSFEVRFTFSRFHV